MYEENQYEKALALWRVLESDTDSLSLNDQARYAYLRGMTDYRLGYRSDSRHWLAIAKATEQEHAGGLSPEWKQRLEQSLADLNQDVYGGAERFDKSGSTVKEHTTQMARVTALAARRRARLPQRVTTVAARMRTAPPG